MKDGLKDVGHLRTVIQKASSFVSHVRKSHKASEILEKFNKLQISNATRWNSQLTMLRSILKVPNDIMDKIEKSLENSMSYVCVVLVKCKLHVQWCYTTQTL